MTELPSVSGGLRELQVLLKHESLLEQLAADECSSISEEVSVAQLQLVVVRKLTLLSHLMIINPKAFSSSTELTTTLCTFSQDETRPDFQQFSTVNTEIFKPILNLITSKPFPEYFRDVSFKFPDVVTFSLLPSLFGCFWCQERVLEFVSHLTSLSPKDQRLGYQWGRVLFVLPEFLSFLEQITLTLNPRPENITTQTHIEQFYISFFKGWEMKKHFCPSYIIELLKGMKDHSNLYLSESFFKPLFENPIVYGFTSKSNCWERNIVLNLTEYFSNHLKDFERLILDPDLIPISLQSEIDIKLVNPNINSNCILCYDDLQTLCELSSSISRQIPEFVEISMPTDCSVFELYQIHYQRQIVEDIKDPIEIVLRKLLIEMSLVSNCVSNNSFEILQQGIFISPIHHRLALSLQLSELMKICPPEEVEGLTERMKIAFEKRAPNRDLTHRRFASCGVALSQIFSSSVRYLSHLRWEAIWPLQMRLFEKWAESPGVFELKVEDSAEVFTRSVVNAAENWKNDYLKDPKTIPGFDIEFFVIFDVAMSKIPIKQFISTYSQYRKADRFARKAMKLSTLRSEWETADDWKKQIISEQFLIDEIPKRFAICYEASTPGKSILLFVDLIQTCRNALQLIGDINVNLHEYLTLVRDVGRPKHYISWTTYIAKYFTKLFLEVKTCEAKMQQKVPTNVSITYTMNFLPRLPEAINEMMILGKEMIERFTTETKTQLEFQYDEISMW